MPIAPAIAEALKTVFAIRADDSTPDQKKSAVETFNKYASNANFVANFVNNLDTSNSTIHNLANYARKRQSGVSAKEFETALVKFLSQQDVRKKTSAACKESMLFDWIKLVKSSPGRTNIFSTENVVMILGRSNQSLTAEMTDMISALDTKDLETFLKSKGFGTGSSNFTKDTINDWKTKAGLEIK